jgi:hypothetical protein
VAETFPTRQSRRVHLPNRSPQPSSRFRESNEEAFLTAARRTYKSMLALGSSAEAGIRCCMSLGVSRRLRKPGRGGLRLPRLPVSFAELLSAVFRTGGGSNKGTAGMLRTQNNRILGCVSSPCCLWEGANTYAVVIRIYDASVFITTLLIQHSLICGLLFGLCGIPAWW